MATTQSRVSKEVQQMLKDGVGQLFNIEGQSVTKEEEAAAAHKRTLAEPFKLREPGEAVGISLALNHARFLGIDADEHDRIVWLFSLEWMEDGFPISRIERFRDELMAETKVALGGVCSGQ